MKRSSSGARLLVAVMASGCVAWPAGASAQSGRGVIRTPSGAQAPGALANPYMNPYMNPYLNPYATQNPMSSSDAALSFMAAQQVTGGIGSGRLSGVRQGDREGAGTVAPPVRDTTTAVPGAAASRYFNRSLPAPGGPRGHYNRPSSYYQNFRR